MSKKKRKIHTLTDKRDSPIYTCPVLNKWTVVKTRRMKANKEQGKSERGTMQTVVGAAGWRDGGREKMP